MKILLFEKRPFLLSVSLCLLLFSVTGCIERTSPGITEKLAESDKNQLSTIDLPGDVSTVSSQSVSTVNSQSVSAVTSLAICPVTGAVGVAHGLTCDPADKTVCQVCKNGIPTDSDQSKNQKSEIDSNKIVASGDSKVCVGPYCVAGSDSTICPISDRTGTFTLGRIPFSNPTVMVIAHQPVLDAIAMSMGKKNVHLVTAPDYKGVIKLLVEKKIDAAWVGTGDYVQACIAGKKIEPLVTPVRNGNYYYKGAIICRRDKGFKTLADLKGKSVAFVESSSASGYLFPKALFERNGFAVPGDIKSRKPGSVDFLKKHDTVTIAVYLGKYDAGAVYNGAIDNVFRDEPGKIAEMQVLALTGKIMSEPIIVRSDLKDEDKKKIKDAFLSLSFDKEKMPAELGGLEGFKSVDSQMYVGVIKTLTKGVKQLKPDKQ